jgi:hypothetical protein
VLKVVVAIIVFSYLCIVSCRGMVGHVLLDYLNLDYVLLDYLNLDYVCWM